MISLQIKSRYELLILFVLLESCSVSITPISIFSFLPFFPLSTTGFHYETLAVLGPNYVDQASNSGDLPASASKCEDKSRVSPYPAFSFLSICNYEALTRAPKENLLPYLLLWIFLICHYGVGFPLQNCERHFFPFGRAKSLFICLLWDIHLYKIHTYFVILVQFKYSLGSTGWR